MSPKKKCSCCGKKTRDYITFNFINPFKVYTKDEIENICNSCQNDEIYAINYLKNFIAIAGTGRNIPPCFISIYQKCFLHPTHCFHSKPIYLYRGLAFPNSQTKNIFIQSLIQNDFLYDGTTHCNSWSMSKEYTQTFFYHAPNSVIMETIYLPHENKHVYFNIHDNQTKIKSGYNGPLTEPVAILIPHNRKVKLIQQ